MTAGDPTGHAELVHFRDRRSPFEIQVDLERRWRVVFHVVESSPRLALRAKDRGQVPVVFLLRFEAALPDVNCYSMHMEVSWANQPPQTQDYYRNARATWFDYWKNDLPLGGPPAPGEGAEERYRELAAAALAAEAHLTDVPAVQQAILTLLREGGTFEEHHKEGGARIWFKRGRFAYGTYGDFASAQTFEDEARFLDFLHQRFAIAMDVSGEFNGWKELYRRIRHETPRSKSSLFGRIWDIFR